MIVPAPGHESLLSFWAEKLAAAGVYFKELRLEGSYRCGLLLEDQAGSDIDVVLRLARDDARATSRIGELAGVLGGTAQPPRRIIRWGHPQTIAHIITPPVGDWATPWDFWVTTEPLLTMSPYWAALFSGEEIEWQRETRTALRRELGMESYQWFKTLLLTEARWRFCACHALRQMIEPEDELGYILADLPILGEEPPEAGDSVDAWIRGVVDGMGCSRPFDILPFDMRVQLREIRGVEWTELAPPAWTVLAQEVQLSQRQLVTTESSRRLRSASTQIPPSNHP